MGAFGIALRNRLGGGDEAKGYSALAVAICVVFIATILITVVFVKDRSSLEADEGKKAQRISLKDAIHFTTAASFAEIIALFAFPVLSRFMNKKQVFAFCWTARGR